MINLDINVQLIQCHKYPMRKPGNVLKSINKKVILINHFFYLLDYHLHATKNPIFSTLFTPFLLEVITYTASLQTSLVYGFRLNFTNSLI